MLLHIQTVCSFVWKLHHRSEHFSYLNALSHWHFWTSDFLQQKFGISSFLLLVVPTFSVHKARHRGSKVVWMAVILQCGDHSWYKYYDVIRGKQWVSQSVSKIKQPVSQQKQPVRLWACAIVNTPYELQPLALTICLCIKLNLYCTCMWYWNLSDSWSIGYIETVN